MAKKKSKKKEDKKKDLKKKKLIKLKLSRKKKESKKKDSKKKDSKKKDSKKKDSKKKDSKKKDSKKKESGKQGATASSPAVPVAKPATVAIAPARKTEIKEKDHSSNYNAANAVKKLRTLKSRQELLSFTNGEKRVTVTRAVSQVLSRFK